jgi:hypothetical protein
MGRGPACNSGINSRKTPVSGKKMIRGHRLLVLYTVSRGSGGEPQINVGCFQYNF